VTYELAHERPRGEIRLQERHQVSPWHNKRHGKYSYSRLRPDRLLEGIETGCGEHETADVGHVRQSQHSEGYASLAPVSDGERGEGLLEGRLGLSLRAVCRVHGEVGVIHGAKVTGVLRLVLLNVRLVDPVERVHEHLVQGWRNVSHERHQEEGHLENRVLEEVEAIHYSVVPVSVVQVYNECQEP
jgi:hypothetical protein